MPVSAADVVNLYSALEQKGIKVWIDGGWAVDALLGKETRKHADLDVAILRDDLDTFKDFLVSQGYTETKRNEDMMWDLILKDGAGHEIEAHAFSLDENGEIIEEEYWDGYSKSSLSGTGNIAGQAVRCVSLEQLIKTHDASKRTLKQTDYQDMDALRRKYNI
jgi:lincosamide nucleotidyltransferase A/C/D/E